MAEEKEIVTSSQSSTKAVEPIVQLNDVVLSNDGGVLLSGVNLTIQRGEFVYVIGKSGSGKTTLLRSLYGHKRLDAGTGMVCGFDLNKLNDNRLSLLRRKVGIVFQSFRLLYDRTVYDNLYFVLRATGWRKRKEIDAQIEKVLNEVGMIDKAAVMPYNLSEGEQRLVSVARSLINNAELIVADEPTGDLDSATSSMVMELLLKVCHEEQRTVIVSTSDFMMIDKYPSRILCCQDGTITSDQ